MVIIEVAELLEFRKKRDIILGGSLHESLDEKKILNLIQTHRSIKASTTHWGHGILLPKLFWLTVRRNCSSDGENNLKFEAEGQEFAKI